MVNEVEGLLVESVYTVSRVESSISSDRRSDKRDGSRSKKSKVSSVESLFSCFAEENMSGKTVNSKRKSVTHT